MEGGNAYWVNAAPVFYHSGFELVSMNPQLLMGKFNSFNATSATVALAAKLAGENIIIQAYQLFLFAP